MDEAERSAADIAASAPVAAVVLAGRRGGDDPLARAGAADHRAFVEIAGEEMLVRVVRTLRTSPRVGRIVISIDTPERARRVPALASLEDSGSLSILESATSPSQSALDAYDTLTGDPQGPGAPILITTADHALLDHAMIAYFLDAGIAEEADIAVGLVPEALIRERFPHTRRTYLAIGKQRFSGANLFLVRPPRGRAAIEFWRRAESHRKRPWRLVSQFGPGLLIAWALRRLELEEAFERGSVRIGARARPVLLPFAEAAVDVDKLEDLELVRLVVEGKA